MTERTTCRQPAKIILWRCKCGHKNKIARCKCGLEVEKISSGGWRYTNLDMRTGRPIEQARAALEQPKP